MAENINIETESKGQEGIASLEQKLANLPVKPGVYQFKNKSGKVIYVGKAKILRNRVRQYFQNKRPVDAKTVAMISKIADLEVIVVDSEAEALILEDTLIKKLKPRYNVLLRDDKSYPYIRITNEEYPRIFYTRKVIRDGSKYFGPFTDVGQMKSVLKISRNLFKIRSCDLKLTEATIRDKKFKICLDYHIEKCKGPCEGFITKAEYNEDVSRAVKIITGKTRELEKSMEEEMKELSEEMEFEAAAEVRNKLLMLKDFTSKQKIITTEMIDRDMFALARVDNSACAIVFKIREGKLIGKRHFIITKADEQSDDDIIRRTVEKWYIETDFIPPEILLQSEPAELEYLTDWLGQRRGRPIHIHIPQRGDKKSLLNMARANAEFVLREYHLAIAKREQSVPHAVTALQRDLRMKKPPRRIECFDNSHIQGTDLVSSLVVFEDGKPKKSDYRKFKNKTVLKNDDFAAMREVVQRRYTRLVNEETVLPDLIIIDGGKGQLSSAYRILTDLGIQDKITIVGLAKKLEEVFFPGESEPLILPRTSNSLKLIQQLRDEAHRFAITFHRQLRSKRTFQTILTNIPGIGEKTATKLLSEFGSVENIRKADDEKLKNIVNDKIFKAIREFDFEQAEKEDDERTEEII